MSDRYIVIMAGGSGTRFWPASRQAHPKQFLAIGGDRSLLRQTATRVTERIEWDHLIVVTGAVHSELARRELPELPDENVLVEPEGRNTAPCIAWANQVILERSPDAVVAVLPADHFIPDGDDFGAHLDAAFSAATDGIVLLGLVPTRPETGYGYIKQAGLQAEIDGKAVHGVEAFVEKPDAETAERYLSEGGYLWNSGMFVFPAKRMAAEVEKHLPELAEGLAKLAENPKRLKKVYPTLPKISIDYGIMEKAEGCMVLPATFAWSDVGSWDAAAEVYPKDDADNVALGDVMLFESSGCMIDSRGGRLVVVSGLSDIVVVDTSDALLLLKRGKAQSVKKIVEALAEEREELL